MNAKNTKKSPIHENANANITCEFGDGDISRFRSRLSHTRPDGNIISSIIARCMTDISRMVHAWIGPVPGQYNIMGKEACVGSC